MINYYRIIKTWYLLVVQSYIVIFIKCLTNIVYRSANQIISQKRRKKNEKVSLYRFPLIKEEKKSGLE